MSPFWRGGSTQHRGWHCTILPTTVLPMVPPTSPRHSKPDRLRMGGETRFCSKDWINPRRPIPCQSHPTQDSPSSICFSNHHPSGFAYSWEILFLLRRVPTQPLTLPLMSSSVASLRVTPCSSLSCTSLASFLMQHW